MIGNPPYQESDGGNKASAVPIYNKFYNSVVELNPERISFVIPDRWFSGGRGLDAFREQMKSDTHIRYLYDFQNASECFPGMDISGGICYFIRDINYNGQCKVVNHENPLNNVYRYLNEFPVVIRSNKSVSILEKILDKNLPSLSAKVSSQKPFGLRTFVQPTEKGDLQLRWNKGKGPIDSTMITTGQEMIDKTNVIVSRVFYEHAGQADKNGQYRVLSIIESLSPKEVCTETYIVVNSYDNPAESERLIRFLKTKLARFLILQAATSIMITKNSFLFVPEFDFLDTATLHWDDSISNINKYLYDYFDLTESERNLIDHTVKEME